METSFPTYNAEILPSGVSMHFFTHALERVFANAQSIYYFMAAVVALVAVLTYHRNSVVERARWLSSLYTKFYEAPDLKRIRTALDENPPNAAAVQELVRTEDSDFTDYLNFFEFVAYLKARGQLSQRDVAALFDYYLRILSKHEDVRKYILNDRKGYGYLKKLLPRFPAED
jgi:hypothetical protein